MWLFILDAVLIIISLGGGVAAILLSMNLQQRYKLNYINSFMYYQMMLFVFGVYGLFGNILVRNMLAGVDISHKHLILIIELIPYLGVPVLFIAWFMFIKSAVEIIGKQIKHNLGLYYFGSVILMLLLYITILLIFMNDTTKNQEIMMLYNKVFLLGVNCVLYVSVFLILFIGWLRIKSKNQKRLVLWYIVFNIISAVILISTLLLVDYNMIMERVCLVAFFVSMLIPAWFLYIFFVNNSSEFEQCVDNNDSIELIMANYKLTKREWEVIVKICAGQTNNEISDELFISLQTVKDHVYRIFKKTGVKNRVQLVNLINLSPALDVHS